MDAHLEHVIDDLIASVAPATGAVLTRVWLAGPGDLCSNCAMASECPDRTRCLHLVRSDGLTRRLDGPFRRFPFGAREVGRVATSLEPLIINGSLEASGLADPVWLALHHIAGFGAWPLSLRGRCIGVVALFSTRAIEDAEIRAVSATARLAAGAIGDPASVATTATWAEPRAATPAPMVEVQRTAILAALARTGGKVSGPGGAAQMLGMKPTTLESRMRKLGVRKPPGMSLHRG